MSTTPILTTGSPPIPARFVRWHPVPGPDVDPETGWRREPSDNTAKAMTDWRRLRHVTRDKGTLVDQLGRQVVPGAAGVDDYGIPLDVGLVVRSFLIHESRLEGDFTVVEPPDDRPLWINERNGRAYDVQGSMRGVPGFEGGRKRKGKG